ncbi:hypothetical protein FA95DRAFT_1555221 [Auriscalpium vulgare]|uniref:Uncharacterized protein n=1 Tax=Auriscalpium vulgare TaxID=40419 RepID=A0ACB8S324_9AGAM|nr:hypothetical protein FA95DRAFT_1555221 [Auriscalpium vulgare]
MIVGTRGYMSASMHRCHVRSLPLWYQKSVDRAPVLPSFRLPGGAHFALADRLIPPPCRSCPRNHHKLLSPPAIYLPAARTAEALPEKRLSRIPSLPSPRLAAPTVNKNPLPRW